MDGLDDQNKLIDRVARTLAAPGCRVSEFDTHISRVLVAGKTAYKFKKAVRLPFLDFSRLESRRFYCQEECRLNRRLAPEIYIDAIPVTGDPGHPVLGGPGPAIEYAVRMHAFEQEALWSFRLPHRLLAGDEADQLAARLAGFHLDAASAPPGTAWGRAQLIGTTSCDTLAELAELVSDADGRDHLSALREWEGEQRRRLGGAFEQRRVDGMIRECHGDLHCANVLTMNGQVQVFDCIEFSDSLRWIDVMSDLAFIHMDLGFHGRPDLAARLLNRYLEISGDYPGLAVLPYYRVHRALVRAKVMLLRARQAEPPGHGATGGGREGAAYLAWARRCAQPRRTAVMITHGYSGSGKTSFARRLVELLDAIALRSDVERKRLHGMPPGDAGEAPSAAALYGDAATRRTYAHLGTMARAVVEAGWPVVVDAACLQAWQRAHLRALAAAMDVPFFMFDLRASRAGMAKRILERQERGGDASDAGLAVLARQLANDEPLAAEELAHAIVVDTEPGMRSADVRRACAPVLAALGTRPAAHGSGADGD